MTYNDFYYERIDLEESKAKLAKMITDFKNADNAADQISVIKQVDNFSRDYMTYQSMASLNYSRDINSEKAKKEKDFYDSISPDMREAYDSFDKVLHKSKFKKEIIHKYGETFLKQIEISLKTFDSKIKSSNAFKELEKEVTKSKKEDDAKSLSTIEKKINEKQLYSNHWLTLIYLMAF